MKKFFLSIALAILFPTMANANVITTGDPNLGHLFGLLVDMSEILAVLMFLIAIPYAVTTNNFIPIVLILPIYALPRLVETLNESVGGNGLPSSSKSLPHEAEDLTDGLITLPSTMNADEITLVRDSGFETNLLPIVLVVLAVILYFCVIRRKRRLTTMDRNYQERPVEMATANTPGDSFLAERYTSTRTSIKQPNRSRKTTKRDKHSIAGTELDDTGLFDNIGGAMRSVNIESNTNNFSGATDSGGCSDSCDD